MATSTLHFHFHFPHPPRLHLLLLTTRPLSSSSQTPSWLRSWSHPNPNPLTSLPRRPSSAVDYRSSITSDEDEDDFGTSHSTGSSTMGRIVEKLQRFGYKIDHPTHPSSSLLPTKGTVEDIFHTEDGDLPNTRGGFDYNIGGDEIGLFPWEKKPTMSRSDKHNSKREKRERTMVAELTLPDGELRRLRHLAMRIKSKMKVGGAGVTNEVVEKIRDKWRTEEVVRVKVEGAFALNMRRVHEILERKTGGLVIWRSGTSLSLYRGVGYDIPDPSKRVYKRSQASGLDSLSKGSRVSSVVPSEDNEIHGLYDPPKFLPSPVVEENKAESPPEVKYEHEIDKLLDELGPRYDEWPGCDPLPVDADLLPSNVQDYKPPFRILPYGVKPSLGLKEATALRRLARVLPPHFAVGRSRQLQGLATAMVKLWEKSSIAKIALKRGIQLTTSERMAEDIKKLTGGIMLSRNKDFIVFYRGKDFLSSEVTEALLERERLAKTLQDEEEKARLRAASSIASGVEAAAAPGAAGTLGETLEADSKYGNKLDDDHANKMTRAVQIVRHAALVRKLERKLLLAENKIMKAENALAKVEAFLKPVEHMPEFEAITDEERFMFRKLGLRMKAFLLLGRRGVFDGTIENMHLHWKYRELIKILVKAKTFAQVKTVALSLEAESGGVLVSVDKVSKGYAIVVYRGKEYRRPAALRPKNLLTKRKALARSIELQRREALNLHITKLNGKVEQLKSELRQMEGVKVHGDELYDKLDAAYSDDEEMEEFEEVNGEVGADVTEETESYLEDNTDNDDFEEDDDYCQDDHSFDHVSDDEEDTDDAYIKTFGDVPDDGSTEDGGSCLHAHSDDGYHDDDESGAGKGSTGDRIGSYVNVGRSLYSEQSKN